MVTKTQKFHGDIKVDGNIQLPSEAASRVLINSATNEVEASTITAAELGQLAGISSPVQAQITAAQEDADLGVANALIAQTDINDHKALATGAHAASAISNAPTGNLAATTVQAALNELQGDIDAMASATVVADLITLTGVPANSEDLGTFTGSLIPDESTIKGALQSLEAVIEGLPDPMEYKGLYNADTNTPALADGTGNNGDVYQVTVAGSQFTPAIEFLVGDKVVYNGATAKYEKWDMTDAVISVNGQSGIVVLDSDDITEGATNLYFNAELAQDAIGAMVVTTNTVTLTYDDATPELKADVKTQMSITSDASGIMLVNDAATPGNVKYYGTDAAGLKGYHDVPAVGSTGDIQETSFAAANNVSVAADVTGLVFANAVVRSFEAQVAVVIDATAELFEVFKLVGIQKASGWDMSVSSVGDESGFSFEINSSGQIQYKSTDEVGYVSSVVKFKASTLSK